MSKKIYKCVHGADDALPTVVEKYNFDYNLANESGIKMAELAERSFEEANARWATLPLCHTVEAQAFGSSVELDYKNGNKIVGFPVDIGVPSVKHEKVQVVLDAIRCLKEREIPTQVNVIGPVSLATSLLPTEEVYRGMAKNKDETRRLFSIIEDFLAQYISEIMKLNVDVLSYADPTGTIDIIGKRLYQRMAGPSFLEVLRKINITSSDTLIHMCPKSSSGLLVAGMIEEDENGLISGGCCISGGKNYRPNRRYKVRV